MISNKSIITGVLSYGLSGSIFHCPFLEEHNGFELNAVVERTKKKAHLRYPNIKSFNSVDELISNQDIELVVVNTPNHTHFEYALKSIREHKHVLVEKPFTVTSFEAKQLFQEAKVYKRCLIPYQNRRYDSDFLSIKKILDSGDLGELVEVHIRYDKYRSTISSKIEKESEIPGSGILYDLGPHLLDAIIMLFGFPLKWSKYKGYFRPNTKVEDYAHIHLLYPKGLNIFVTVSMIVADKQPAFILNGTKGSFVKQRADVQEKQLMGGMIPSDPLYGIEEQDKYGILTTISKDGNITQKKIASEKSSYMHVFENVYQTIRKGKIFPISKKQIIQQLEILET